MKISCSVYCVKCGKTFKILAFAVFFLKLFTNLKSRHNNITRSVTIWGLCSGHVLKRALFKKSITNVKHPL
jgi:hypothetical protein